MTSNNRGRLANVAYPLPSFICVISGPSQPPSLARSVCASTRTTPGTSGSLSTRSLSLCPAPAPAHRGQFLSSLTAMGTKNMASGPRPTRKPSHEVCVSVHLSLLFVAKQPHPKSIFLDSTCGLLKGLRGEPLSTSVQWPLQE